MRTKRHRSLALEKLQAPGRACLYMVKDTLRTKEAAELLEISQRTLFRYANKGLIRPYRLSKRNFRWLRSDLEDLVNNSKGGDAV